MNQGRILIVDDEAQMRNLLRIYLTKQGYEITEASSGQAAFDQLANYTYDLVILDVMMPGLDGFTVCEQIRSIYQIPILMLTARVDIKDKVRGLTIGADDYLTKPFDSEELIARVGALLRRSVLQQQAMEQQMLEFGQLKINPLSREIIIDHQTIDFTPKEFDLLLLLASNPHRVFARDIIIHRLWSYDYEGDVRSVDTHVKNIREKSTNADLDYNPILTVWGVGYKFNDKGASK
ncbi:response regulator transcription factor [Paenibacillus albiflavus]|uniref:response regulator transcription factor n=1 Tax=Paenibacillus albiflavus TaxID=2545760 RepID=UPI001F25CACC|nr:response regulator transcription factor [Paenibacillus albiflavus]